VLVVALVASAVAMRDSSPDKVTVANPSTTVDTTDTTSDREPKTTTTVDATTTAPETPATVDAQPPVVIPTPPAQPPHDPHDYSMLRISWPETAGLRVGNTKPITYTVTNTGSWDVEWMQPACARTMWGSGNTPYWQPFDKIWPQPTPSRGETDCGQPPTLQRLAAGASAPFTEHILAGYHDRAGNIFPSPPGPTSFQAAFMDQCSQPCDPNAEHSLSVVVYPPDPGRPEADQWFQVTIPKLVYDVTANSSVDVSITYMNPLVFAVRMPLYGPCWKVDTGTATVDCSGPLTEVTVGPGATVKLSGKVWARTGFKASGAPLEPGMWQMPLGDAPGSNRIGPGDDAKVYLNVSA
jgi:hypothetical protein